MSSVVRPHVPEEELHAYADGELSPPQRAEIAAHLLACLICRAQLGEVEALRERSALLLAAATPRAIRQPARLPVPAVRRPRRRSLAAAAAVGILSVGSWLTQGPGDLPSPHLSSAAFVAPAIFARVGLREPAAPAANRTLTLAARSMAQPRMILPAGSGWSNRRIRLADEPLDVDPAPGWELTALDRATEVAGGPVTRIEGLPVTAVRMQRAGEGTRPSLLVRQKLANGLPVWVLEGTEAELAPIQELLSAAGVTLSQPQRAHPDYATADDGVVRTRRVVTVAGYLPKDSLDALAARVKEKP